MGIIRTLQVSTVVFKNCILLNTSYWVEFVLDLLRKILPVGFSQAQKRKVSVSSPILHPDPLLSTPPSPAPAEQRQLLFVGYTLCPILGVRICLFTDAGGRDAAACVQWVWGGWGGGVILMIVLGLVPTRFLFGSSAPFFSDIFKRGKACVELKQLSS